MPGRAGSPFGNPFRIGPDGTRAQVIEKYREWLNAQPELLAKLHTLKGLRLGCWCDPLPCHVCVIVELLEGPLPIEVPQQGSLF
jgi:hypothetical protein